MLISFIGSPCSGKTTTAAMVFSELKDLGHITEFIPEQARIYIANKKVLEYEKQYNSHLSKNQNQPNNKYLYNKWNVPIILTDEDQTSIMNQQNDINSLIYSTVEPSTTIVTDSSPVNSLFYMSTNYQDIHSKSNTIIETCKQTSLFFYVKPIPNTRNDALRIHDNKFSIEMDNNIISLIGKLCPDILHKIIPLTGSSLQRKVQALTAFYEAKFPQG